MLAGFVSSFAFFHSFDLFVLRSFYSFVSNLFGCVFCFVFRVCVYSLVFFSVSAGEGYTETLAQAQVSGVLGL